MKWIPSFIGRRQGDIPMRPGTLLRFPAGILLAFLLTGRMLFPAVPLLHHYSQRIVGIRDGLAQGTICCMLQTPDGYIWFGNQEALSRFDGTTFTNFNRSNTPVFKRSWVQSLALSRDHQLLIGTWRGGVYRRENHEFVPLSTGNRRLNESIVYALESGENGNIWAGTSDGLFKISSDGISRYGEEDGLPSNVIRSLATAPGGTLWIGFQDQGLASFRKGRIESFDTGKGLKSNQVWALAFDSRNRLWIGNGMHLSLFHDKKITSYPVPAPVGYGNITSMEIVAPDRIWLGLQNGGLWLFESGHFSRHSAEDGLSSDLVLSILRDREDNLWVGTSGSGINQFSRKQVDVISQPEGLSSKVIWTVMEDHRGDLWIGTHGGGLNRVRNGSVTRFSTENGLSSMVITALLEDPEDGSIWAGTADNGINHLRSDTIISYRLGRSLEENTVYCIYKREDQSMMIGTAAGLALFENGRVTRRLTTRNGLTHNSVREITPGPGENCYYISTDIGLTRLEDDRITGTWNRDNGLAEPSLNGLYLDRDEERPGLWIGTYGGGIACFREGKFTIITDADGLFNNVIYEILEDAEGRFWMSSNRGIFSVSRDELVDFVEGKISRVTSLPLGINEGMRALECNGGRQPAGWITRDQRVCFPTIDGVAVIDTQQIQLKEKPPSPVFEEMTVDGRPVDLQQSAIVIPPGRRDIDIRFTAPFFKAPDRIRFQHRLKNFEESFSPGSPEHRAYYTNIPPGHYLFQILVSNRYGVWSEEAVELSFFLRPFFYETLIFRISIIALVIGLILLVFHWRTRQLARSKRLLETAVKQRTRELRIAYDKMKRISLTDPLTRLYNRRYFHNIIDRDVQLTIRQQMKLPGQRTTFAMGFLMIDIDHFKQINDNYGHKAGDIFLQKVSARFLKTLRSSDLIVRWGGEEFLVLSKENDFDGARLLSLRLLRAINGEAFQLEDQQVPGSVSIGFCPFPVYPAQPRAFSWEDTVNLADQALYLAKRQGRNRSVGIRMDPEKITPDTIEILKRDFHRAQKEKIIEITTHR